VIILIEKNNIDIGLQDVRAYSGGLHAARGL